MKKSNLSPVVYAALYLKKKTPTEKVAYGSAIVASMTGSATLPTPDPTLTEYMTIITDLSDAIVAVENGGSVFAEQTLANCETDFDVATRRLADYVQNVANATESSTAAKAIINSAGMMTRKSPEKTPVPVAISKLEALFTNVAGTVLTKWKGVKNTRLYAVYFSTGSDLAGTWTFAGNTPTRQFTVEGLTSNTRYYFKVVALGVHGSVPAVTIATCIAS